MPKLGRDVLRIYVHVERRKQPKSLGAQTPEAMPDACAGPWEGPARAELHAEKLQQAYTLVAGTGRS